MPKLIALIFILFALAGNVSAKTVIYSYYIPGLVDNAEQGIMVDMLKKIEASENLHFDLRIMPIKRAQLMFARQKIPGYFPELNENLPTDLAPDKYCRTVPFMKKKIITISRQDQPLITDMLQLYWKRIGAVKGYSYGNAITKNPNIQLNRVENDEINLKKLMANRIDVIVGDVNSTVNAIHKLKLEKFVKYDASQPVDELEVFFVFLKEHNGQQLCNAVSQGIEKLRKQKWLKTYFDYE